VSDDDWMVATSVNAIDDAKPVIAKAWGDEVAVYKVGKEYFANSNFCTHSIARLSDGTLNGYILECPLHQALFDIRDGHCAGGMDTAGLTRYEVRVREDTIEIRQRKA
jgi:nitrite reductase/ring-hydroxylating ferredoxin subunit